MPQIDVIAVVGPRAPVRVRCAKRLAERTQRAFVPAARLAVAADPIEEAIALVPWTTPSSGAVVEFPAETPVLELIGALTAPEAPTRLLAVVCVADAERLEADLADESYVTRTAGAGEVEHTARAWLTVTQVEHATTIVLANADRLHAERRDDLIGLLGLLAPTARIHAAGTGSVSPIPLDLAELGPTQARAGWSRALSGDLVRAPRGAAGAFRYENERPLHPWRLHLLLAERFESGEFGTIVRSAGFCRLATRPGAIAQWEQVGAMFDLVPLADAVWSEGGSAAEEVELLTLGQDLFVAGYDLDRAAFTVALDDAALHDGELVAGPDEWRTYPDPFPDWLVADDHEH
ncbi:GTP-binding protein [Leifsonia sp. ZF2019]|uniref:GTP-binding protein n=1 Tax=Leifsonia sp. ZF2019 TaxID=2781978 RepID=UPI001CBF000A|nr:GTP-binding protein [Leifsonia sp. ZF2019]UAJ80126.1 GTP-binding protein [Leifsonia sp. ZF2019]